MRALWPWQPSSWHNFSWKREGNWRRQTFSHLFRKLTRICPPHLFVVLNLMPPGKQHNTIFGQILLHTKELVGGASPRIRIQAYFHTYQHRKQTPVRQHTGPRIGGTGPVCGGGPHRLRAGASFSLDWLFPGRKSRCHNPPPGKPGWNSFLSSYCCTLYCCWALLHHGILLTGSRLVHLRNKAVNYQESAALLTWRILQINQRWSKSFQLHQQNSFSSFEIQQKD